MIDNRYIEIRVFVDDESHMHGRFTFESPDHAVDAFNEVEPYGVSLQEADYHYDLVTVENGLANYDKSLFVTHATHAEIMAQLGMHVTH